MIGPGPNARRTSTSVFQDGKYQEAVFRKVETQYPDIEHLGNWHTHHVNGLETLSTGDIDTYNRVVNHRSHNTNFFYALLVVAKKRGSRSDRRYAINHFLICRDNPSLYEIPPSKVRIAKTPPVFVDKQEPDMPKRESLSPEPSKNIPQMNKVRLADKISLFEMYPDLRPFMSKQLESLYWRGKLDLIDDTSVEVIILESIDRNLPSYRIALVSSDASRFQANQLYANRSFESARRAIWAFERDLNREIFGRKKEIGRILGR